MHNKIQNDIFNIASENHMKNLEVVNEILSWFNKDQNLIKFVENRWGQDLRYSIDASKIRSLGWSPKFPKGLHKWF